MAERVWNWLFVYSFFPNLCQTLNFNLNSPLLIQEIFQLYVFVHLVEVWERGGGKICYLQHVSHCLKVTVAWLVVIL